MSRAICRWCGSMGNSYELLFNLKLMPCPPCCRRSLCYWANVDKDLCTTSKHTGNINFFRLRRRKRRPATSRTDSGRLSFLLIIESPRLIFWRSSWSEMRKLKNLKICSKNTLDFWWKPRNFLALIFLYFFLCSHPGDIPRGVNPPLEGALHTPGVYPPSEPRGATPLTTFITSSRSHAILAH